MFDETDNKTFNIQTQKIFDETDLHRETFLDIQNQKIFDLYKIHCQSYWTPEEIDLSHDYYAFCRLPLEEQDFIKKISTFFLISDAVVCDNVDLISAFDNIQLREIKA